MFVQYMYVSFRCLPLTVKLNTGSTCGKMAELHGRLTSPLFRKIEVSSFCCNGCIVRINVFIVLNFTFFPQFPPMSNLLKLVNSPSSETFDSASISLDVIEMDIQCNSSQTMMTEDSRNDLWYIMYPLWSSWCIMWLNIPRSDFCDLLTYVLYIVME